MLVTEAEFASVPANVTLNVVSLRAVTFTVAPAGHPEIPSIAALMPAVV